MRKPIAILGLAFAFAAAESGQGIRDWPASYPLGVGIGLMDGYYSKSAIASVEYGFRPPFAVTAAYTMNRVPDGRFSDGALRQSIRIGLQTGKFLTRNVEFLGSVFHRAAFYPDWEGRYVEKPCSGSQGGNCSVFVPRTASEWHPWEGTGASIGTRIWIWSRMSLELNYGREFPWGGIKGKSPPTTVMFLPSLRF